MPGFNKSGPNGLGPMTGRGGGLCNGGRSAGGMGRGMGCGRGLGRRGGFSNQPLPDTANVENPTNEIGMLKTMANSLKNTLDMINQRLSGFERGVTKAKDPGERDT